MTKAATNTQAAFSSQRTSDRNLIVLGLAIILAVGAVTVLTLVGTGKARGPLNDNQVTQFLRDDSDPGGIVYALSQLQERMRRQQPVSQWYPELTRLANTHDEQVGHMVADMMGRIPSRPQFHEALLSMLRSRSVLVKNSAALSLAEFGDGSGREQLLSMMYPARLTAPVSGRVDSAVSFGTRIEHGSVVARLTNGRATVNIYSPISGQLRALAAQAGDVLSAGTHVATIEPDNEQLIAVLHALELVGHLEDLPAIQQYENANAPELRERAKAVEKAIRARERAPAS
ncbi:MAG: HlyD family efflux transporter periplasmic adaptor subunit [Terriglobales bacterium]